MPPTQVAKRQHAGIWYPVPKTADESKATNATLANDSELSFAMLANTKYAIRIAIFFTAPATPGFKYALSGPASPTLVRVERQSRAPAGAAIVVGADAAYTASTAITGNATSNGVLYMDVIVQNGANAGTFAFQWAQNVSNATAAVVLAGSYLEYLQI